jgi:hypothetical protein
MPGCDLLYYDSAHAGAGDGWRPCRAPGLVWTDPELVLRFVCREHRRQLTALHAAGLADRTRWARDGLATGTPTPKQGGSPCASTPPAST